jgi:hypothetical protein
MASCYYYTSPKICVIPHSPIFITTGNSNWWMWDCRKMIKKMTRRRKLADFCWTRKNSDHNNYHCLLPPTNTSFPHSKLHKKTSTQRTFQLKTLIYSIKHYIGPNPNLLLCPFNPFKIIVYFPNQHEIYWNIAHNTLA